MTSSESIRTNDSAATPATTGAQSSPAHQEAWTGIKNLVMNKATDKVAPTVIIGDAAWGPVNLSLAPKDVVEGTLDFGRASMHQIDGKQFFGDTPWGTTKLAYKDSRLAGSGPWGDISVKVTAQDVNGDLPWGKIHLALKGQDLSGPTPWGTAHLRLGDKYHSLTNPDVLMALSAILSDK